ncbi:MAG: UbiA family prenyltransferase [Nitrososphaerota archaeon]
MWVLGIADYLTLTRPPNSILMYVAVLVGVLFSETRQITPVTAVLSFITAYGLNGASMVINDYFDRLSDAVNKPQRPIPSGRVAPGNAVIYSIGLAAAGISAAAMTSVQCLALASLAYTVSFLYNCRLKASGLLGNALVSIDVVAPFVYGAVMADGFVSARVLTFGLLAFLANNGREVIKGISDVEADRVRGVVTVAAKHGPRTAAYVGSAHYVTAVALSPIPYLLRYVGPLYLPIVGAAGGGFIYTAISIIIRSDAENSLRQKRLSLLWMFIALVSFLVGGLDLS